MKQQDDTNMPVEEKMEDEVQSPVQASSDDTSNNEAEEWKAKYFRALADYKNLERRTIERESDIKKFAAERTIKQLLTAIDSLERAAKHIDDPGFQLSLKEFHKALESMDVKKMEVIGQEFDPMTMECIQLVDPDGNIVIEELTSGYTMHDKVLRVAQVNVGKNKK